MKTKKSKAKDSKKVGSFTNKYFFHLDKAVKPQTIYSDKVYFEKTLRIGIELESSNIGMSCSEVERLLKAQRSYTNTDSMVQRVYPDGTVRPDGVEVVFKGSNETFNITMSALTEIEKKLRGVAINSKVIDNSSASSHITLLTSQNREIPDTYLANYYQLYRKYSDVLVWLTGTTFEPRETGYLQRTGAVANKNRVCRKGIRGMANPLMIQSPQFHPIKEIGQGSGKYYGMYFKHSSSGRSMDGMSGTQQWLPNGNPSGICIEFRFLDRCVIPSALVSFKCLLQAMLFKAIELSEFGIINVESNGAGSWDKTKTIVSKLVNGSALTTADKTYLAKKSNQLIDFVLPNLKSFDGQSIEVLRKLASLPIGLRYARKDSVAKITKDLTPRNSAEYSTERQIRQIIQLQLITGSTTAEWRGKVAKELGISDRAVRHSLQRLQRHYSVGFDRELKTYILVM